MQEANLLMNENRVSVFVSKQSLTVLFVLLMSGANSNTVNEIIQFGAKWWSDGHHHPCRHTSELTAAMLHQQTWLINMRNVQHNAFTLLIFLVNVLL